MNVSLIQRVVLGFAIVTFLVLATAGSAYVSQIRMAQQLELSASTLTGLLDKANTVILHIQNANRAMMQHANIESIEGRQKLRVDFENSKSDYEQLMGSLINDLKDFPDVLESIEQIQQLAESLMKNTAAHLDIHDRRVETRALTFAELTKFEADWLFFRQDMGDLISMAERQDKQQLAWDIKYVLDQGMGAETYVQRASTIFAEESLESYKTELNGHFSRFSEKLPNIMRDLPNRAEDVQYYLDQLERAIVLPDGLFQQHLTYVGLNNQSRVQLAEIAEQMDTITLKLSSSVASIRKLSSAAIAEADAVFKGSLTINAILALVSIVIAITITVTVVRAIKSPLTAIMKALALLSDGDLTYTIDTRFRSEMGLIAKQINQLNDNLGLVIFKVQQSAHTISNVASENHAMSAQTHRDVTEQREETDSVSTAVNEMEAAIQEVAANASDTSDEVSLVTEQAHANMENMNRNLEFVNKLKTSLDSASGVIKELSNESQQIGDILNVIQGIAEQTNLLALNAAIEAARAGEQGRGFAVVADEVRSLANRTQHSANEIRIMIESLQGKAHQAVSLVESNLEHADQSVQQTIETNHSLNEMVTRLTTINDMSRAIATASEEQSAVAKEVAKNVVHISDMAENIASSAENASSNSEALNELSSEQRKLVSQFSLKPTQTL